MFVAEAAQQSEHARIVARLLGGTTPKSHPPARALGYRTRARVHIEAKRDETLVGGRRGPADGGTRGRVMVGMFARGSHEPAPVDTCVVLDPVLDRAREALGSWLEGAKGRGEAQLGLGLPGERRKAVLDLRWSGDLPGAVFARLERAVKESALAGVRIFSGDARLPAKIGDPTPYIVGADGIPLRLAPGGFSQATEEGNALLVRRVAELARELPPGPCTELYAGAGNLTVLLARDRETVAVEQDHDACVAARENLEARGLTASVVETDASAYPIPKATRLVVLDPPREGARAVAEDLAERARKSRAPAIVYVACDPPTLARDVRTLTEAGYIVRAVETFEMFPHTSHVETVVVLVQSGSTSAEPPAIGGSGGTPRAVQRGRTPSNSGHGSPET
jgi:23S rRNA (uracil1939-C5)-methyltransferase